MDTKKVNNKTWNGEDSAFLRCISSENKSFYDVPIVHGANGNLYGKMCECASLFVHSITGAGSEYGDFDYWMRFSAKGGEIVPSSNDGWCLSGVCGYDDVWFKGDINTLEISGVSMFFMRGMKSGIKDAIKKGIVADKDEFIDDYNNEVKKAASFLYMSRDCMEYL